ncbi:methyltransferase domain-containing protein [Streptacidiphilus sp. ASG 303]|uniref:class I SAM-dependent methyltransferase n=1 Tax=Streptacidiphilus sp. ASG 303 TaxID=2896847 RepID=UPI001E402146|nr:class I SAM-dependent methyltransferase [Streptacidiphilus sp. ASG 303]MCD0485414.1 methyltransferase domain-containing protein [Streptacidiphilus sp. ASG 303]
MPKPELAPEIERFYSHVIDEDARLSMSADGRLELLRTKEILRRFLPPAPARVLDVGGGTGVHACWLVKDGYRVDLVDPIARHVEQAAKICPASLGDARALEAADNSYDVVQLLGPLYHLPDPADRDQTLTEALRVLAPGGLVAAAAINRYSALFEHAALAHLQNERLQVTISEILRTAVHNGRHGFTLAYFHRAEELVDELRAAGFTEVSVFGIEGPAWSLLKTADHLPGIEPSALQALFESVLTAARLAEPYPELLSASSHLLAVGRAPE